MDEPAMIFEQQISLPYTYTAGAAQRAALLGFRAGAIVASSGGGHRVVPARPFAANGTALRDTVRLADEGELVARTVAHHLPGAPAYGLIRLDGATTLLLHRLGDGAGELPAGARVRARWRQERSGSILDIEHFGPA
jgi:uncharacterized OB-fold protein